MEVRRAQYAGSWYPGEKESLNEAIKSYLAQAGDLKADSVLNNLTVKPKALIVPHAGYVYSAPTAAAAFSSVKNASYSTVIVLAPSHRLPFDGVAVWDNGAFATPLGEILVDIDFISELKSETSTVKSFKEPHLKEHSLEMELPFLQYLLSDFKLVPLIIGGHKLKTVESLFQALDSVIGSRSDVLVVASTDLSHFHSSKEAEKLDGSAISYIEQMDGTGLMEAATIGECELCGLMPVATVLSMESFSQARCVVANYTHSGKITGDNSSVVGYVSAVIV